MDERQTMDRRMLDVHKTTVAESRAEIFGFKFTKFTKYKKVNLWLPV